MYLPLLHYCYVCHSQFLSYDLLHFLFCDDTKFNQRHEQHSLIKN